MEVAVLGLHAGLIALALRQTFQIFNRGLIVNGDNKGGVAQRPISFFAIMTGIGQALPSASTN